MELASLLADQDGVVSRRQVLACGLSDDFIESRLRRKDWARVHRGIYVDHTGPLSWRQRVWAALLFHAPAAACDQTALALEGMGASTPEAVVHVGVDESRRVTRLPGTRTHRLTGFADLLHPSRRPSRLVVEAAVLRVAARARDDAAAVAVLGDACQSRRTTPARLAAELGRHPRLPRRALLADLLEDVACGAFSALEHRYLVRVERPHGLPTVERQRRVRRGRRVAYRDVEYLDGRLVVELDGRLGHDATVDRWADLDRDIDSAGTGTTTVRLSWGQVLRPCRCAEAVGRLLNHLGWDGGVRACGDGCTAV